MIGNRIKTTLFLGLLAGLFIGMGYLLGNKTGMIIGFSIAMAINLGSYWFSDKIVLKMYKAIPASKDSKLYLIVANLARSAKMPMPKVYTITASAPNAFATGRNPKNSAVAATESLMDLLSEDEVKGVMAHELSHIKHRDTLIQTISVGIAASIAMVAEITQWALIFGLGGDEEGGDGIGGIVGSILIIILTPIIATIIQLAISRQREYLADEGAAKLLKTPIPLINALNKLENMANMQTPSKHPSKGPTQSLFIVNPFRGGSIMKLFSTHPTTKSRIEKLKLVKVHR